MEHPHRPDYRLRDIIWDGSIYAGFPSGLFRGDREGWQSDHPIFEMLITHVRPQRILELGTWKGASAIQMAQLCAHHRVELQELVCIDTWLGSAVTVFDYANETEVVQDPDGTPRKSRYAPDLRPVWGYPTLYHTFLANVIESGLDDVITPLPISSTDGLHALKEVSLSFDLIYIDASHQYEDVKSDLELSWSVLSEGGVVFGDDFTWSGVRQAVTEVADELERRVVATGDGVKWMIGKDQRQLMAWFGLEGTG